jgi:hypothetical protein
LLISLSLLAAACLLSPSHVFAFAPPLEPIASPFAAAYLRSVRFSPAGLAYFPLLGLGLLSFLLNLPSWHWQRSLPWAGLAVLSAFQERAIPFFAVVAGPVLAWNLQELVARRARAGRQTGKPVEPGPLVVLSRFLVVCLFVGLLVCAWPGWLQAPQVSRYEPRRWGVDLPPSLEAGAVTTQRWYQEGKLRPGWRGLHLTPQTVNAFAWFCPEEKAVLDPYLSDALLNGRGAPADWVEGMRSAGIDHVVVYHPDWERTQAAVTRLLGNPKEWPLLFLEGNLAVFGWRDPAIRRGGSPDPFRGRELDLNRLAFHRTDAQKAPRKPPDREPEPRLWWDAFWKNAPPRPLDRDEARMHLLQAEVVLGAAPYRRLAAWEAGQGAALVGAAAGWGWPGGLFDGDLRRVLFRPSLPKGQPVPPLSRLALTCQQWFAQEQDGADPASLYLAIRACRRALAESPEDAQAHLTLGEAYLRLLRNTRERVWGRRVGQIVQLRRAQASAALNQAVSLQPDLARAHDLLAALYREMGYLDLQLIHLRTCQELARHAGPSAGTRTDSAREVQAAFEREVSDLGDEVARRESAYAAEAGKLKVADRALLAVTHGLAGKARDLLLASDVAFFGPKGMALELELLLRTGRARDAREWTNPEQKSSLGAASYHWLRAQALAAVGQYALAEEECEQLGSLGDDPESSRPQQLMALLVGQAVLDQQPALVWWFDQPGRALARSKFENRLAGLVTNLRRWANANVFRGLIALEQGNVEEAEVAFRLALDLWKDEATAASGGGLDFSARPVAQACLAWLR